MLKKSICYRCCKADFEKWYGPANGSSSSTGERLMKFLFDWRKGWCQCHQDFTKISVANHPPKNCPYIVEHSVYAK